MVTMPPEAPSDRVTSGRPAGGRPVLFTVLLAVAALGVLALLVAGPALAPSLAVVSAAGLISLMGIAWAVAGPRL
ncbi:hypothetical protein [Brachybacterium sp. YJGR34]|uniref:hypothetical protein n=1 Tax=Brachybacterium sp. YJGR34 TaxID=2059911 RepID=UPI000E0B9728|nr:hypothetical protein [Brachybacterium sp. YJGR34]